MIVEIIEFLKKTFSSKFALNYVSALITVFCMFQLAGSYAVDTSNLPKLDVVAGYAAETKVTGAITKDPSYNSQTTTMNIIMGAMNGAIQNLIPQVLSNYDDLLSSSEVPQYSKVGAIGAMDSGVYTLARSFEGVNVPRYLASEWVPGYQSNTSIYAADDGYGYLQESNIDALWDRLRLIAYVFFVVILIVAGFMIMFRQKIGGQLAVSVFNVLPNIIISLILVTFSFAIVGLMINFGVMAVNIVGSVLGVSATDALTVDSPFTLLKTLVSGDQLSAGPIKEIFAGAGILGAIGLVVIAASTNPVGAVALTLVFGFIVITFVAIVIYASVRVYITILTAYLLILFNTLMAPIVLTVAAFPGQSWMIGDWFKRVLKAVLTFPLVFFFLNLGAFILDANVSLAFPSGFLSGDLSNVPAGSDSPIGWVFKSVVVLALFFFAADSPKLMDDFLQTNSGKGAMEAIGGMKKGLSRIPIVGSFFG